jgi:tripartite-type tricarboxylate transporter receptor subunit TctC
VPYRGAGPALNDLLGGHIDFMFDPGVGYEHAKAGRLRMIATTAAQRHADFPQAPTMADLRIDVDAGPYFGIYAPKGTPKEIINRMNVEVAKALEVPETRQRLEALLLERTQMTPEKFAEYMQAENKRYASLVPELGLDKK